MSDSQKFPIALHTLAYLAHKGARSAREAVCSVELAASMPTNPVVVRRVTALLAKAGLIGTRAGAHGGAWLTRAPDQIRLDSVLTAVHGCAHLGSPLAGAASCPGGEKIPAAISKVLAEADRAVGERLGALSLADLIADVEAA